MSRLPSLTAKRLVKILQKIGFYKDHQRGSHLVLKHSDGRVTVVPMHAGEDIGRGLLRKILRDIQIEPDEFRRISK